MPFERLESVLHDEIEHLERQGTAKGIELIIRDVLPATGRFGPRYLLDNHGDQPFLKMNSNSYLGMSLRREVIDAEEEASRRFGTGPGAVRFISGTYRQHVELEERLAAFHGRAAAMIYSSAYATTLGVLVPLITPETAVISDELNHNCIINAMRLARPQSKGIYKHNDVADLEARLEEAAGTARRAIVVTDGIFSMRGDHAPLAQIVDVVRRWDERFPENVLLMVDDSHGVGAFGETGRGTEEVTGTLGQADLLVGTLGKAFGVNGGYVTGNRTAIRYLRETAITYIYSNPITQAEAAAALTSLQILDSEHGHGLLRHLRAMTRRFEEGMVGLGYETIPGEHPVTPLMVRDTARAKALVRHLFEQGILVTGLTYPVVPKGDESLRFQVNADHTETDIDEVLDALASFPDRPNR